MNARTKKNTTSVYYYARTIHRQLGYFLAGIMSVYAFSGILLIYRKTDLFKVERIIEKKVPPGSNEHELGKLLKIDDLKFIKTEGHIHHFTKGQFNSETGMVSYAVKKLPYILKKLTQLHKTSTKDSLYWLNTLFGVALLLFVFTSFWMYRPQTPIFKKSMYYVVGGMIFALILILI